MSQVDEKSVQPAGTGVKGLVIEGLGCRYGDQVVLDGIDMQIPIGGCAAVLGTNGAGKTTLMNAIAGLHRPIEGEIVLDGVSLGDRSAYSISRSGVCYIPEGRGVFPDLTVADNLRISIGKSRDAWERYFGIFPAIESLVNRQAGQLSGGQQQMLAIAPAVVDSHRLILIDEISMGLAPVIVDELFELLAALRKLQSTLILVEQFADRALRLADQAYVIRKGNVVYDGASDHLLGDPAYLHSLYLGDATTAAE